MNDPTNPALLALGPFDLRPTGELARHLGDDGAFVVPDWRERRVGWLLGQLRAAGVDVAAFDVSTVEWLAGWEAETVHAVGAWVARAAAGAPR